MNRDDVKPGDWVRFYSNGKLVIGVVQYPPHSETVSLYVDTDVGMTPLSSIREVRRAPQEDSQ